MVSLSHSWRAGTLMMPHTLAHPALRLLIYASDLVCTGPVIHSECWARTQRVGGTKEPFPGCTESVSWREVHSAYIQTPRTPWPGCASLWALGDSAETALPIFQDLPENQMAWLKGFGQSTAYILSCHECKHHFSSLLFHKPDFAGNPGTWDRWRKGRFPL